MNERNESGAPEDQADTVLAESVSKFVVGERRAAIHDAANLKRATGELLEVTDAAIARLTVLKRVTDLMSADDRKRHRADDTDRMLVRAEERKAMCEAALAQDEPLDGSAVARG